MKKRWLFALAILILIGILPGCLQMENMKNKVEPETKYSVPTDCYTQKDERYLVLVNKTHPIPDDYNPEKETYRFEPLELMTEWVKQGREQKLEGRTLRALGAMLEAMRTEGITDVFVTSSYRTLAYQSRLFNNYYESEKGRSATRSEAVECLGADYIQTRYLDQGKAILTDEDAEKIANYYSAKAGQSEHHTGLCVDLMTEGMKELDESFVQTAAFEWLSENAHLFGFILRYPKGKEDITGYCYEPWHYRFVGVEAAAEIWEQGISLEEYLEEYRGEEK